MEGPKVPRDKELELSLGGIYRWSSSNKNPPCACSTRKPRPSSQVFYLNNEPTPMSLLTLAALGSPTNMADDLIRRRKRPAGTDEHELRDKVPCGYRRIAMENPRGGKRVTVEPQQQLMMPPLLPRSTSPKVLASAIASAGKSPALNGAPFRIHDGFNTQGDPSEPVHWHPVEIGGPWPLPRHHRPGRSLPKLVPAQPLVPNLLSPTSTRKGTSSISADTIPEMNQIKGARTTHDGNHENPINLVKRLPLVSATGDNKAIQGFMFTYPSIGIYVVCICQGYMYTPQGFVHHAGCKDVSNPMQHIKLLTPTFSLG